MAAEQSHVLRHMMVERQIRTWEVLDERVLELFRTLAREDFVPPAHRDLAYADASIPLPDDQVMLEPKIVARALQGLDVQPDDSILEVGTGSGFVTACLASLGGHVKSCEIRGNIIDQAAQTLANHTLNATIELLQQDSATLDWTDEQFDVICVNGSMPFHDIGFAEHLKIGGRLFVIEGSAPAMEAVVITRTDDRQWDRDSLFETVVPALDNVAKPSAFTF